MAVPGGLRRVKESLCLDHINSTKHPDFVLSSLADVCRQSIIFDSVAGMVACLELILLDNNVEVFRIKNKMDPAYNSARSVGYRVLQGRGIEYSGYKP